MSQSESEGIPSWIRTGGSDPSDLNLSPLADVLGYVDQSPVRDTEPGTRPGTDFLIAVYSRYGSPLHGHVLRLVGDQQRAEDIVQETFLRAWLHRDTLDPERAWPWLRTVARNLTVSAHRRTAARPKEAPLGEEESPVADESDVFDRLLERWQMVDALRGLRPEHRAVLVEVYYFRRTVAEAASVLGIPVGTVKSRCYYALRALRNMLEEQGVTGP